METLPRLDVDSEIPYTKSRRASQQPYAKPSARMSVVSTKEKMMLNTFTNGFVGGSSVFQENASVT